MGIFSGRRKDTPDQPTGRRRPLPPPADNQTRPPTMFSYYAKRSNNSENTGRRHADEAPVRATTAASAAIGRHRALLTAAAVAVILGTIYLSYLKPEPRIVLIQDTATANFLQESAMYRQTAEETLRTSLFNRSKLTVDAGAVRRDMLANHPEIKNAVVVLPIVGMQPHVHIEPYKPSFILTTTSSNAFLLDETGRALATTTQIPHIDKLGVPTIQDRTGVVVELGNRALPSTTVLFAQTVIAALKAKQVTAASLVLSSAFQLDVYIAGTPYYVKFNMQQDALQQAGALLATQKRLQTDRVRPGEYIDVRVPERAYYK
jgi:hypothetical protein